MASYSLYQAHESILRKANYNEMIQSHPTSNQIAKNQEQKLLDEFQEIYSEEGEPEDMALFSSISDTEVRTYYFSPAAVKYALIILAFYSGSKCNAPPLEEVTLALGPSDAKNRMLSETD